MNEQQQRGSDAAQTRQRVSEPCQSRTGSAERLLRPVDASPALGSRRDYPEHVATFRGMLIGSALGVLMYLVGFVVWTIL